MEETIRSLGHPRLLLYVLCVTIVGNPAGMRVGRERQRQFVSGHARVAVETAVDVPDHGDALSPDREETILAIQFERLECVYSHILLYCYRLVPTSVVIQTTGSLFGI